MLVTIPDVLKAEELAHIRRVLETTNWVDGRSTAGDQAAKVKHNLQVPPDSPAAQELGQIVLRALSANPKFMTAALPLRVLPPMFNRYDVGMTFGAHVDGSDPRGPRRRHAHAHRRVLDAVPDAARGLRRRRAGGRTTPTARTRSSCRPGTWSSIRRPACTRVTPVTRGSRWASFFWTQSLVKDDWRRHMLYDLDVSIMSIRSRLPDDDPAVVGLSAHYHNLIRHWSET